MSGKCSIQGMCSTHNNVTNTHPFYKWKVYVRKTGCGIKNEEGVTVASVRANTSSLKPNYHYTIYIVNGQAQIYVEPHINMPFSFALVTKDNLIPVTLQNTPYLTVRIIHSNYLMYFLYVV